MSIEGLSQLNEKLGTVFENVPFSKQTTLKIGGPAKYFFDAATSDDIIRGIEAARELGIDHLILGGGSNILVSDSGFDGLVIHAKNNNMRIQGQKLYVEAGALNSQVVRETVNAGLSGLEWLATIPGTIGGAVHGNAGCFGNSIKDFISKVDVYREGQKKRLNKKDCQFSYRESLFKKNNDVILSAEFTLNEGNKTRGQGIVKDMIDRRAKTQPKGACAGSTFKNFKFRDDSEIKSLIKAVKEIPEEFLKNKIIPAGWLLDQVGAKGMEMGELQVSEDHANWIINRGKGRADQFVMLASELKTKVRDEFGIQLHEEIQYIGF